MHYHTPTLISSDLQVYTKKVYTGYFDGCSKFNPGLSSAGYYMTFGRQVLFETSCSLGTKTNNQAEFLGLLYLLVDAYINGIRRLSLFGDSRLVVGVAKGIMRASNMNIVEYGECVKKMLTLFPDWRI